jgi:hypothetical protein
MSTKNYYWDKGYEALEILHYVDLDEEDYDKDHIYTNTVDVGSLGCFISNLSLLSTVPNLGTAEEIF